MTRAFGLGVALLTIACTGPAAAVAATKPLVKLVRGTEYELRDAARSTTVRIPLDPAKRVRVGRLTATVVSVAVGTREDRGLVDAFEPKLVARSGHRGDHLDLTIDTDVAAEPGTYAVIVDVRDGPRRQRLSVKIVHPPATLRAPPAVVVQRTGGFLWWDASDDHRPLRIKETSRKTRLGPVTVEQVDGPTGTRLTSGTVTFAQLGKVAPDGAAKMAPVLSGEFPRGTSTGTLEVHAPQLDGPVSVAYEVRDARHVGWLIVIIALGVVAGYLVRVGLKTVIARNEARQRGYELLDTIAAEGDQRDDAGLRTTIDAITATLTQALVGRGTPEKIGAAVDEATLEAEAAVDALEAACAEVRTQLDDLALTTGIDWMAPRAILDHLRSQQDELQAVRTALDRSDATNAARLLASARTTISEPLRQLAQQWSEGVLKLLATLDGMRLPPTVRAEAASARSTIESALAGGGIDSPVLDLTRVMNAVHTAESGLRRLSQALSLLSRTVAGVTDALRDADTGDPGLLAALEQADRSLGAALQGESGKERDLDLVAERVDALLGALRAAIAQPVAGKAEVAEHVRVKLDAGRYEDAAELAARSGTRRETRLNIEAVQQPAGYEPSVVDLGMPGGVPVVVRATGAAATRPFHVRLARVSSLASLIQANLIRTALICVGIVVGGYGLFAEGFVGTDAQLIAAFFWGFASDITAEGLLTVARSTGTVPAPPAPPVAAAP